MVLLSPERVNTWHREHGEKSNNALLIYPQGFDTTVIFFYFWIFSCFLVFSLQILYPDAL